eukprot:COSAG04_NODE_23014_length_345_cov_0.995935_1_plen_61_part_10
MLRAPAGECTTTTTTTEGSAGDVLRAQLAALQAERARRRPEVEGRRQAEDAAAEAQREQQR